MIKKLKRGEINYIVDVIVGLALLLSIFSGILLLFFPSGEGFRGGRNAAFTVSILGLDRWFVKDLHTISSIVMALGVLGHLLLHWNWIRCMTRNLFSRNKRAIKVQCEVSM